VIRRWRSFIYHKKTEFRDKLKNCQFLEKHIKSKEVKAGSHNYVFFVISLRNFNMHHISA